ncbi:MAG TPA: CPBP family glutamic-type intramembrane protease [Polyangiaceae bacterium]|nr:CPBP family glutamic-type intramembrane protease [Polyangiaceae bacterium]
MTPRDGHDELERLGRRRFHLALAGVFTVFLSPLVSWWVALRQRQVDAGPWRARLLGLALLDTVTCLCFLVAVAPPEGPEEAPTSPPALIGVTMSKPEPPGGVEITTVAPGSPAEHAGVRPGDTVTAIDETPVGQNDRFRQIIGETEPGASRTLHVRRGGSELDLPVTPEVGFQMPPAPVRPLFEPVAARPESFFARLKPDTTEVAKYVLPAAFALVAWRRGARAGAALWLLGALAAASAGGVAALFALEATIGASFGTLLLSQLAATLTMLALGWYATRRLARGRPADPMPPPTPPMRGTTAFGLGFFYEITGILRAAALVAGLSLLRLPNHSSTEVFGLAPSWGGGAVALFGLSAIVVGPLAEECLFRGLLLPWLATWMKPSNALWWSALAFALGHLQYGTGALIIVVPGLVFGWARQQTGSLRAGIALHTATNALMLAGAFRTMPL